MNLVYYCPMDKGSPSNVARRLLAELTKHTDILPFSEIILFSKPEDTETVKKEFQNLKVISYKELSKISGNYLVHFPVLPTILPNSKFLLYLYSKFIKRKKIIIQYHGDVRTELRSSYTDIRSLVHIFSYIFLPNLLKSADSVITHSYYMNKIIKSYGVTRSAVIPNAVDNYWFQQNNKLTGLKDPIDKNSFNLFYHGRLSWEKGIDVLLEAVGHYTDVNEDSKITVYIAGEGPQKENLEELCSKLNISKNVVFVGNISKEQIICFLKNVDCAIYPSRFDNFPLAVLEALACADCPVYFSKNIGIYDFVIKDGFKLNSFELNVENLIRIMDSASKHNNKNENTIHQQVKFAEGYTWDQVIFRYVELYRDIINKTII